MHDAYEVKEKLWVISSRRISNDTLLILPGLLATSSGYCGRGLMAVVEGRQH
jgi:hypothetical protein